MTVLFAERPVAPLAAIGLTVGDLRRRLAAMDDAMLVLVPGPEGGLSALDALAPKAIVLNVNADPLFGPHDVPADGERADALAVVLRPAPVR